ncbi:MAG: ABC transporter ATP-binding protein [Clostridia bacterium]|nr:ABC transporter ATP-binding protein [Clostridia bacterium]
MKNEKKKRHSFINNTIYMFRLLIGWDKAQVPISLTTAALDVIFELNTVSFITALTFCLEHKKGIKAILFVTGAVALIELLSVVIKNLLLQKFRVRHTETNRKLDILLAEKVMNMDFDLIEGTFGREKYQKARNTLTYDGLYGFVYYYQDFFRSLLFIAVYGIVTVNLNLWLIVVLTGLEALKLVSLAIENHLVDKTRDPMAETDRKLNYINKTSRDFAIGKDIRVYKMRNYLMRLGEYFVGERKFWTSKMYFYYFCSDMFALVVSVGIEIGVFAYLVYATIKGSVSKTELVLFACTITEFTFWLDNIGECMGEIIPLNIKIDNLREFLDIKNRFRQSGGKALPSELPYEIELRDVSFTYPGSDREALSHISLTVKRGENLALVGVNGAGKTTLVKLICGLYQPTGGKILLNGINISEFNRDEYYGIISALFQEPRFLPCTVLENVSMQPRDKSDKAKFSECIEKAGLIEKVQSLPEKENTYLVKNVNENAVELSGGEMQRLLLARALYKDSPVLLLDEPTAALDPIAENEIYLKYNEMSENKTSLYISHRLSSTRFCDRIILLDEGRIAETGTHDELLGQNGKYAEMFRIQSKYYRKEAEDIESRE